MSKATLKKHLENLKSETTRLRDVDPAAREKMAGLISEIEHVLDDPDDSARRNTVIDDLKSDIERFEIKHPDLTAVLNQIMVTLGNMGI